jgi:hypothetical protein
MTLYQWFTVLGLPTVAGLAIRIIQNQIQIKIDEKRDREAERERQKATNKIILRILLRTLAEKYCKRGYATLAEKDDFEEGYLAYHDNGGNGVMDASREDVIDLPSEPPKEAKL